MCMQKVKKVFLTEMDDGEARKFLLHKESYVAPNYPKYYNFKYLLEYGKALLGRQTLDDVNGLVIDRNYGDIPDVNYTIQFNKSKDHSSFVVCRFGKPCNGLCALASLVGSVS